MSNTGSGKIKSLTELRSLYGRPQTEFVSTGILGLDELWGGGVPSGKIIEVYGQAGTGKTTLILQICKTMMDKGFSVGYADVEHALDESLRDALGITPYESRINERNDQPYFTLLNPATFRESEQVMNFFLTHQYDFIVFDSITQLVADKRLEETSSLADDLPGLKARLQSAFLDQYKHQIARSSSTFFLINQMRTNLAGFRAELKPAGGQAIEFNTDIRCGMRRVSWIKDKEVVTGELIEIGTIKNKLTQPFRKFRCNFYFGKGVDVTESLANVFLEKGIVTQSGAYFSVPDGKGGRQNVRGKAGLYEWLATIEVTDYITAFTEIENGKPSAVSVSEASADEEENFNFDSLA